MLVIMITHKENISNWFKYCLSYYNSTWRV